MCIIGTTYAMLWIFILMFCFFVFLNRWLHQHLTRSANAVEVRLRTFGEVKIDDNVHCLDVDSPSK